MQNHTPQKKKIEDIYPLSPMQEGMLFHALYSPESSVYFEQIDFNMHGALNVPLFKQALENTISRHAVLRSAFVWKKLDKLLQVVHKTVELPFTFYDWSALSTHDQEEQFEQLKKDDRKKGFDLSDAPLLRVALIRIDAQNHKLLWSNHHIIFDGWSIPIIFKDVFTFYELSLKQSAISLPPAKPFRNYIGWLGNQSMEKAEQFWRKELEGFHSPSTLGPELQDDLSSESNRYTVELNPQLSNKITTLSKSEKVTINTLIQAVWAIILQHHTAQSDVLFGATVSGRPPQIEDVETMVGLFINTLPIRVDLSQFTTFNQLVNALHTKGVVLRDYEYTPLVEIQRWSAVPSEKELFNALVVFENYPVEEQMEKQQSSLTASHFNSFEQTNFPLTFLVAARKQLHLEFNYNPNLFEAEYIQQISRQVECVLEQIVTTPHIPLKHIKLLPQADEYAILNKFNQTVKSYKKYESLITLFNEQVALTPHAPALKYQSEEWSYKTLDSKSNLLAQYLVSKGVKQGQLIGVAMERSLEMVTTLYAILKAGAAYVPLDPDLPDGRINQMVETAGIELICGQSHLAKRLKKSAKTFVDINAAWPKLDEIEEQTHSQPVAAQSAAYMIFTSGSTGIPKGVIVDHAAIINRLQWMQDHFKITAKDVVLQKTPYSFDVSVWEFFWPLLYGAKLVIAKPDGHKEPRYLAEIIIKEAITTVHFVPAMLHAFLEEEFARRCSNLNRVICSGEALSFHLQQQFFNIFKSTELHNLYGPTEAAVDVTYWQCEPSGNHKSVPIGFPIANTEIYILDDELNPVAVGVAGELHIAGIQLARGYHNNADLTAEKFIPNPFSSAPGSRLYKTGDLARYKTNGAIEYISRIDHQVKIRGLRIELGEIEFRLTQHLQIEKAAVKVVNLTENNPQIAAYYTGKALNNEELTNFLSQSLADYMVPDYFIHLPSIPVTKNGKTDKKALPLPEQNLAHQNYVAPRNALEETLAIIWKNLLKVEKVGIYDPFFDLGGHSLLATRMISKIREAFNVEIALRLIFENNTIALLAPKIEVLRRKGAVVSLPEMQKALSDTAIPASLPQQRLWFIDQFNEGQAHYNIPFSTQIEGVLEAERLENAINYVVSQHESLRTSFRNIKGLPFLNVEDELIFKLEQIDLSHTSEKQQHIDKLINETAQYKFVLNKAPLFKVVLIKTAPQSYILTSVLHHIISDGWSMNLFVSQILEAYSALPEKSPTNKAGAFQYSDYAQWQKSWLKGSYLEEQISFWKENIGSNPPVLELNTDFIRPTAQTFNGAVSDFIINGQLAQKVEAFGKKEGLTNFISLLSVFHVLMQRYSGMDQILVGSPVSGRHHAHTAEMMGMFVNTLVLKADFSLPVTFKALTKQVRENMLDAFAHQDLPFEQLVDALEVERHMAHAPLFQVAFVPQDPVIAPADMDGLRFEAIASKNIIAKYDLTVYFTEAAGSFHFRFEYNTDLFKPETIERMAAHYRYLIEQLIEKPATRTDYTLLLTEPEKEIINLTNRSEKDFEKEICVNQLFERMVKHYPQSPALVFGKDQLTYQEMNKRANQLAHFMRKKGVGSESIVGIYMDRSFEMVISMVAIAKAGGAYLPLDPSYPTERLHYMVEDAQIKICLSDRAFKYDHNIQNINIFEEEVLSEINSMPDENLAQLAFADNIAYVIYTSGSTGKPKGTVLSHRGVINLAQVQKNAFNIDQNTRILQFASLSFDAATWEATMSVLNGAALHLVEREVISSGEGLVNTLKEQKINIITLPPSVLAVFPKADLPDLETIITAGEKISADLVKKWQPGRRMINAYGPTETTVCATMYTTHANEKNDPPIGTNLDNFKLHILDENFISVPLGVSGELCIGGPALARGYHNLPYVTAEKFIPNPYASQPGDRLYRTGDLVRRLPDGNIEFMGRIDHQVKIRGFRVELGEIEATISNTTHVKDVIVILREDLPGEMRLVAYFVADEELTIALLRDTLHKSLPDYMVPSALVKLDKMPLTPNGKIDRRQLPVPEMDREQISTEYLAPRNETEEAVSAIVAELLHLEQVGINDNFFDLGGHSLLATQFISQIREKLHLELPLRAIFETPTVRGIAHVLLGPDIKHVDNDEPTMEILDRSADTELDDLADELEGLSDEEIAALLDEDELNE